MDKYTVHEAAPEMGTKANMLTYLGAQLLSQHRRYPLRWHLAGLLVIKAIILYLIWLAWFSHPVNLNPQQVSDNLLTPTSISTCSEKDACDATQP